MESFEKPKKPETDLNRRKFLGVLGGGALAAALPAEAKEVQQGPEIMMSPEAERKMNEWGITLNRYEITGPSDFREYNPVKWEKDKTADTFMGVCLTSSAKRVEVNFVQREDGVEVLSFGIKSASGKNEGVTLFKYPPTTQLSKGHGFRDYYMLKQTAESYREGRCSGTALVS